VQTVKTIALSPYPGHLLYVPHKAKFKKAYREYANEECEERFGDGLTIFLNHSKTGGRMYMIYAKRGNQATLAHEIAHLLFDLFKEVDINPSDGSSEPFCYMLSHLMEECTKK